MNTMQQSAKARVNSSTLPPSRATLVHQLLFAALGLFLMVAAYKCVVQKSFLGDDHVHLVWLREAVKDPSLVLRNFGSNWLYAWTTPQCYRPLISVFMFTDYLVWHRNAVGFHITNLVFLVTSCAALFGCVFEVGKWSKEDGLRLWPVFAACTFALYPSHPETVSWVTGRVDGIVTAFYLISLYLWMLWRRTGKQAAFAGSVASMLLSLASKEMAVTIPVVLFLYEFLRPMSSSAGITTESSPSKPRPRSVPSWLLKNTIRSFASTGIAWGILAAYFVLRRVVLGTFIGGYDDTLAVDCQLLASNWISGLHKLFVPINCYYEQNNTALTSYWTGLTIAVYLVALVGFFRKAHRNQLLFFLGFAVASLLPVYKLFIGMPDLQGSRFSFLASAPIAALFAFGLAHFPQLLKLPKGPPSSIARATIAIAYFFTAASMLWLNNQPWTTAGRWASTMESQFRQIFESSSSNKSQKDDHFLFFNTPNNYRGAYLARNAIGDMGGHENLDWRAIEQIDRMGELGQCRDAIANGTKAYKCFYWSDTLGAFVPQTLPPNKRQEIAAWNSLPFSDKFKVISGADRAQAGSDGLTIKPGNSTVMMLLNLDKLTPWQLELLELKFDKTATAPSGIASSELMEPQLIPASMPSLDGPKDPRRTMFVPRLMPGWFSATKSPNFVVQFPSNWAGHVTAEIAPVHTFLPKLTRTSKDRFTTTTSPISFSFDVAQIPGAAGAIIEISKRNAFFSQQNTDHMEPNLVLKKLDFATLHSQVTMTEKDFVGTGAYQIRCWAIDKHKQPIGLSSDYILAIVL
ncbi:MAG TPA: hypothetical protein V6C97_08875 [Oculatellaceae cyanobacterium]